MSSRYKEVSALPSERGGVAQHSPIRYSNTNKSIFLGNNDNDSLNNSLSQIQRSKKMISYVQTKSAESRYDLPTETFFTGRKIVKTVSNAYAQCFARVDESVWVGNKNGSIHVYDLATGDIAVRLENDKNGTPSAIQPIGVNVWVGFNDGTLRVYDSSTYSVGKIVKEHTGLITRIMSSFNNVCVYTTGVDFTIKVWDASSVERIGCLTGHKGAVRCLVAVSGVRLFSGSDDGTIIEWDLYRMKVLHVLQKNSYSVQCLCATNNYLWSGSEDGILRIWALFAADQYNEAIEKGKSLSVCRGSNVLRNDFNIVDYNSPSCIHTITNPHTSTITHLAVVGSDVWSCSLGTVFIWDSKTFQQKGQIMEHKNYITCIDTVHQSLVARVWSCSADGVLKMWNTESHWLSAQKAVESGQMQMLEVLLDQGARREDGMEKMIASLQNKVKLLKKELEYSRSQNDALVKKGGNKSNSGRNSNSFELNTGLGRKAIELQELLHKVCQSDFECEAFQQKGGIDYEKLDFKSSTPPSSENFLKAPFSKPVFDFASYDKLVKGLKALRDRYGDENDPFESQDEVIVRWKKGDDSYGNCLSSGDAVYASDGSYLPMTENSKFAAENNLLRMELLALQAQVQDLCSNAEGDFNNKIRRNEPESFSIPNGVWNINIDNLNTADIELIQCIKKTARDAVESDYKKKYSKLESWSERVEMMGDEETKDKLRSEYPAIFSVDVGNDSNNIERRNDKSVCGLIPVSENMTMENKATLVFLCQKSQGEVFGAKTNNLPVAGPYFTDGSKTRRDIAHLVQVMMSDGSVSSNLLGYLTVEELEECDLETLKRIIAADAKRMESLQSVNNNILPMLPRANPTSTYVKSLVDSTERCVPVALTLPAFSRMTIQEISGVFAIYNKYRGKNIVPCPELILPTGKQTYYQQPPGFYQLIRNVKKNVGNALSLYLLNQNKDKSATSCLINELKKINEIIDKTPMMLNCIASSLKSQDEKKRVGRRNEIEDIIMDQLKIEGLTPAQRLKEFVLGANFEHTIGINNDGEEEEDSNVDKTDGVCKNELKSQEDDGSFKDATGVLNLGKESRRLQNQNDDVNSNNRNLSNDDSINSQLREKFNLSSDKGFDPAKREEGVERGKANLKEKDRNFQRQGEINSKNYNLSDVDDVNNAMNALENENAQLHGQLDLLSDKNPDFMKNEKDFKKEIAELKEKNKQLQDQIDNSNLKNRNISTDDDVNNTINALENENAELREQLDLLSDKNPDFMKNEEDIEKELAKLEEKKKKLQNQIDINLKKRNISTDDDDMNNAIDTSRIENSELREQLDLLSDKNSEFMKNEKDFKKGLAKLEKNNESSRNQIGGSNSSDRNFSSEDDMNNDMIGVSENDNSDLRENISLQKSNFLDVDKQSSQRSDYENSDSLNYENKINDLENTILELRAQLQSQSENSNQADSGRRKSSIEDLKKLTPFELRMKLFKANNEIDELKNTIKKMRRVSETHHVNPFNDKNYENELERLNNLVKTLTLQLEDLKTSNTDKVALRDEAPRIFDQLAISDKSTDEILHYFRNREDNYRKIISNLKKELNDRKKLSDIKNKIVSELNELQYLFITRPYLIRALYTLCKVLTECLKFHIDYKGTIISGNFIDFKKTTEFFNNVEERMHCSREGARWIIANLFTVWELHHLGASPSMFQSNGMKPTWKNVSVPPKYITLLKKFAETNKPNKLLHDEYIKEIKE